MTSGFGFCDVLGMRARMLHLHFQTSQKLLRLRKEAEGEGQYRVAKRIHAVLLNHEGLSSGDIAAILQAPRSKVSQWLNHYEVFGYEALLEGQRSGRPGRLSEAERARLADILDSGPRAYGFLSGVWNSPMIGRVMHEEFNVQYTPRHVRRILDAMDFSVQRPKRVLARADPAAQSRWRRYTYPNIKKKPRRSTPS